jgi:hypothetical protein
MLRTNVHRERVELARPEAALGSPTPGAALRVFRAETEPFRVGGRQPDSRVGLGRGWLLALLPGGCAPDAASDLTSRVDSIVGAAVDDGMVAGIAIPVLRGGEEIIASAHGRASIESARAATPKTRTRPWRG